MVAGRSGEIVLERRHLVERAASSCGGPPPDAPETLVGTQ